jgi:hypothetical protein
MAFVPSSDRRTASRACVLDNFFMAAPESGYYC